MSRASEQFERLMQILVELRGENGCPWDKEQTAKSLIPYLLEETYEVIEAIEENNTEILKEELGDLLLHIIFQAQIAKESSDFEIADSIQNICDKLVNRHPHVFSGTVLDSKEKVNQTWETLKWKEKKRENFLDGVPKKLPALTRARRIQEKASNVGFDWKHIKPIWDKVDEELNELKIAWEDSSFEEIEEELGDVIFSLVNLGRFLNISSEDALRKTISKFENRFKHIESELKEQGKQLGDATLEEMNQIWEATKDK